jgi:lysozyme family protein
MKQNFDDCLNRLLKDEGGYTNHPLDPGGPTNFGITLTDYQKYINPQGTANDVKKMRVEDAKSIYRTKYWDALGCSDLASGVDYTCFDYGVNSGLGRPRKALQRFKSKSGVELIDAINDERMAFLKSLSTWSTFGKGWGKRVEGVRAYSKVLATRNNVAGPVTGTVIAGTGITFSQYIHAHQSAILIGASVLAVVIGILIHLYANKGK